MASPESGKFALTTGIGLDRDPGVAGQLGKPGLEVLNQVEVSRCVLDRRKRMQVGKTRIGDRLHLSRCVELHRAGTEWDDAAIQREIPIRQGPQVAKHCCLTVMGVEDRVTEVVSRTLASGQVVGKLPLVAC